MAVPSVRPARREDHGSIVAALARAFEHDPFAAYALPDGHNRVRALQEMFDANFTISFWDDCEVTTGPACEATAVWASPQRPPATEQQQERLLRAFGVIFGERLGPLGEAFLRIDGELKPTERHWYLEFLGTDPVHQGKGFGAAVLSPQLDRCDAAGEPAYLWTAKEANLAFYRRHGFDVLWEWQVPDGPVTWGMWRPPQV